MLNTDPSPTNITVTFQFEGHEVRVLYNPQGEAWFVAGDVAAVLGYRDALNMVRWLDDDESDTQNVSIRSENGVIQSREVIMISESGLYHALFKSRRPGGGEALSSLGDQRGVTVCLPHGSVLHAARAVRNARNVLLVLVVRMGH